MKLPVLAFVALLLAAPALADETQQPATKTDPAVAARGVAVLGVGDSADATWPLAQSVYANDVLRPSSIDEPQARILAGDPLDANATRELKDLADLRNGIHGDDAASRALLTTIANRVHVKNVLVVFMGAPDAAPSARLFTADVGFDAASYQPDDGSGSIRTWSGTVRSLSRFLTGATPTTNSAASTSTTPLVVTPPTAPRSEQKPGSKPFYLSPWFWGAIGAAAFGGLAVFLVTRDTSDGQIHLQMQVPK